MLDDYRQVLAQIRDVREWVARVKREGRQNRGDLPREVPHAGRQLLPPGISEIEESDALSGERGAEQSRPRFALAFAHRARPFVDERELLAASKAVDRDVLFAGPDQSQERRDADHEELVKIGRDDGKEADAFEQRVIRFGGLRQHAFVERQPAQLSIEEELGAIERVGPRVGL